MPGPVPQQELDEQQIKRQERKIVEETENAGGTVHEFNPDLSPAQKAAAAGRVNAQFPARSMNSLTDIILF